MVLLILKISFIVFIISLITLIFKIIEYNMDDSEKERSKEITKGVFGKILDISLLISFYASSILFLIWCFFVN